MKSESLVTLNAKVTCENTPSTIALAMIEAEVPGDAKIVHVKYNKHLIDHRSHGMTSFWSAVEVDYVTFTFEWERVKGEDYDGVPSYERKFII